MIRKYLICPERKRHIPSTFSWVDHRLVRDRHICQCTSEALALYLFLVTVADTEGLSYYSDNSMKKYLTMNLQTLRKARNELGIAGLIAYKEPLYQVLELKFYTGVMSRPAPAPKKPEKTGNDNDDDDQPPMFPAPLKAPAPITPPRLLENNFSRSKKITPVSEIINTIIERNSP